ncbi:hypothetical protein [Arachidicoccus terrestris]|nr:hypothetical protein [Arachidicoccus terrestris]UAY54202.1 hypothetical protein K9M52_12135 [Arachidicoccus terrestris]
MSFIEQHGYLLETGMNDVPGYGGKVYSVILLYYYGSGGDGISRAFLFIF